VEAIWHLEPVFHQDNGDISTDAQQTLILSSSFVTVGLIIALVVLFILYYRKRKKYV
jgi:LPXTG-motif cell wall-anchored protein